MLVTSTLSLLLTTILIFRIVYGPLVLPWLVTYHYLNKTMEGGFVFMLTFRIVIKLFFILDFDRMSSMPEKRVLTCFNLATFACAGLYLFIEYTIRSLRELHHFPRMTVYIWLGMVYFDLGILINKLFFNRKMCQEVEIWEVQDTSFYILFLAFFL